MHTQKALKIAALSCVAIFAIGVLAFGLATGFGIDDLLGRGKTENYDTPYTYTEELEYLDALVVEWANGPVEVSVYDGDVVTVTETAKGTLREDEKLEIVINGGTLSVHWDSAWMPLKVMEGNEKALKVQLPKALVEDLTSLSVQTASGDVSVQALTAREIKLQTASGSIEAAELSAGQMTLVSVSGTVHGTDLTGTESMSVSNVSGETVLDGVKADVLTLSTTSGKIEAEGRAESISCKSVSGAVALSLQQFAEKTEISTVTGSVELRAPETDKGFTGTIQTVSGDVTCGFAAKQDGDVWTAGDGEAVLRISTTSGAVTLEPTA